MPLTETDLQATYIPTHHPQYWQARRLAFAAIKQLDAAIRECRRSPMYICDGYDADGEPTGVIENIGPFDRLIALQKFVSENPNAMSILEAQKQEEIVSPSYY